MCACVPDGLVATRRRAFIRHPAGHLGTGLLSLDYICVYIYPLFLLNVVFGTRVDHSKAFVCTTCGWGFFCFGAIYLQGLN